jgi:RNA polymerase sigma-70 factor (ECF subfamily)
MSPIHAAPPEGLHESVQSAWHRFLDAYEPHRPDLHRYCRHLARTPWDAEDLAQEVMTRAFAALGCMAGSAPNPRAWLFRVASNLWIDRSRRAREPESGVELVPAASADPVSPDAAASLLARLAPQERAAVVLKDVFEFSLEETASALATTVGAVKSALHRARGKLADPEPFAGARCDPLVVDAFCAAFNARDIERLTALLLDTANVEIVGVHTECAASAPTGSFVGMLYGARRMSGEDPRGGMESAHRHGVLSTPARVEAREHQGELLVAHWYAHADGEYVRAFSRLETEGGHVARIRNYFYTPEFIAHLAHDMGLPFHVNGYRYW